MERGSVSGEPARKRQYLLLLVANLPALVFTATASGFKAQLLGEISPPS